MGKQPAFDAVGERFVGGYYETVRGKVREELTRKNLYPFLPPLPALAADIGGGDGRDSGWLADQGYEVTLVDTSTFMLDQAARWGTFKRLHGDQTALLEAGRANSFDLVLSHGVLMYDLDDPVGHLKSLTDHLQKGGILSLLTKGYGSLERRYQTQGQVAQLAELQATHQFQQSKDGLAQRAWAFKPDQLMTMLQGAGMAVLDWSGVRIASDDDRRLWQQIPGTELRDIIRSEGERAHDPEQRQYGHMLHFIAQKQ